MNFVNYKKIFIDVLIYKYPSKMHLIMEINRLNFYSSLNVIKMNNKIFEKKSICKKQNAYSDLDIEHILEFQRINKMNNIETAIHFNMSRNTLTSWKKKKT